jgi:hypothetical protein
MKKEIKTTLFTALKSSDVVICNGYEIDGFVYDEPGKVRLECGEDVIATLSNQEIRLDEKGFSVAEVDDVEDDDLTFDLEFKVLAPLSAEMVGETEWDGIESTDGQERQRQ